MSGEKVGAVLVVGGGIAKINAMQSRGIFSGDTCCDESGWCVP